MSSKSDSSKPYEADISRRSSRVSRPVQPVLYFVLPMAHLPDRQSWRSILPLNTYDSLGSDANHRCVISFSVAPASDKNGLAARPATQLGNGPVIELACRGWPEHFHSLHGAAGLIPWRHGSESPEQDRHHRRRQRRRDHRLRLHDPRRRQADRPLRHQPHEGRRRGARPEPRPAVRARWPTIEGSDDPAICADADVVVITAGAKQKPGQTRMDLAKPNAEICRKILSPSCCRVCAERDVPARDQPGRRDHLRHAQAQRPAAPAQVLGSGTVLDSSRFRFLIAQRLQRRGAERPRLHRRRARRQRDPALEQRDDRRTSRCTSGPCRGTASCRCGPRPRSSRT